MSDLYCEHHRTRETCEDCRWQAAQDDPHLLVADPRPEATRKANEARAQAAADHVKKAAALDDELSLAFDDGGSKRRK